MTTDNVSSVVDNTTLQDLDIMTLNCSQGFFVNLKIGHCSPTCGAWKKLSYKRAMDLKVPQCLVRAFHSLGGIMALVMAVYNYKRV